MMKWALYNVLFALVYPFLLPGFLLRMLRRGGYAARMGDRFALYPEGLFGNNRPLYDSHSHISHNSHIPHIPHISHNSPIWIHAVSVGEVQVAGQLMREWRKVDPSVRFCFSTTSSTGWQIARKELDSLNRQPQPPTSTSDILIYNPLDFPNFVKSALRTVRPRAIVLTESEIWPNFILQAKKAGIPLFLINARVSDRSAPRYRLARFFFKDVLSSFTRIFAQSDLDKERLVAAGAPADIVDVTGSFKFDVAHRNLEKEEELRRWILGDEVKGNEVEKRGGGGQRRKILLGGSTWPGEDEVLLRIYESILNLNLQPQPLLVLAPRHFEKADAVEANILKHGFACIRRSRGNAANLRGACRSATGEQRDEPSASVARGASDAPESRRLGLKLAAFRSKVKGQRFDGGAPSPATTDNRQPTANNQRPIYLADTTGELMGLYGIADVVFVGKSLCAHGSQNMIEPCLCGKPTVVGPYTENFRPVMSDLLASEAIVQVRDEAELREKIVELVDSCTSAEDGASPLGTRAAEAVRRRCGVVARCVEAIRSAL